MNGDFILWSLVNSRINNFSSENYFSNFILFIVITLYMFKDYIFLLREYIYNFFPRPQKLIFESEERNFDRFDGSYRPLLDYILENHQDKVKCFKQENFKNYKGDGEIRDIGCYYVPEQKNCFLVDESKKIYVYVYNYKKEKTKYRDETDYRKVSVLELYSYYSSMKDLISFEKKIVDNWNNQMEKKYKKNKYIFSLSWENEQLCVTENTWSSFATFENSFFPKKEDIVKKIDYFLHNREDYIRKGNPYTLGILLYGLPGGGKTRFIKQLINHTGRHAVEIDLKGNFDFGCLKNILNSQDIGNGIKIPTNKKIFIFEDIDASTKKLKNREKPETEPDVVVLDKENKVKHVMDHKNTLSTFLNIMDGVKEADGRICIFTTNYIDKIDPAVFRPGRIDIKIKVKKLNIEEVYQMCKIYWKEEFNYKLEDLKCDVHDKYTSAMLNGLFKSVSTFDQIKSELI